MSFLRNHALGGGYGSSWSSLSVKKASFSREQSQGPAFAFELGNLISYLDNGCFYLQTTHEWEGSLHMLDDVRIPKDADRLECWDEISWGERWNLTLEFKDPTSKAQNDRVQGTEGWAWSQKGVGSNSTFDTQWLWNQPWWVFILITLRNCSWTPKETDSPTPSVLGLLWSPLSSLIPSLENSFLGNLALPGPQTLSVPSVPLIRSAWRAGSCLLPLFSISSMALGHLWNFSSWPPIWGTFSLFSVQLPFVCGLSPLRCEPLRTGTISIY